MASKRVRERKRQGMKVLKRLTTKEWIQIAKEDSGMLNYHDGHVKEQKRLSKCKSKHKEAETRRKHGPLEESTAELLPFHLIFSRLPVRQLFQLRCVCKLWNSMLGGDALAILPDTTNTEQEEYWFVMSRKLSYGRPWIWNFRAFSTLDGAFPLPTFCPGKLSTFLGGTGCELLPLHEGKYKMGSHWPRLVGAGGLMCAFVHKPDAVVDYHVIVFNCLTGSVKVLPPLLNPHHLSAVPHSKAIGCNMYMAVDEQDPSRYYIMLTHLEVLVEASGDPYFEIFDSRKGCWRVGCAKESATPNSKTSCGDFFFDQWYPFDTTALLAYHAADDLWSKVSMPMKQFDELGFSPTFSKYKGRLLQGLSLRSGSAWLGFVVRELHFDSLAAATWVEVARTPKHLWWALSYTDWFPRIIAEGSLFCMAFEDKRWRGHFQPPLVYDIDQNSWYVLPFSIFGCISVFRPRLSLHSLHLEGEE